MWRKLFVETAPSWLVMLSAIAAYSANITESMYVQFVALV